MLRKLFFIASISGFAIVFGGAALLLEPPSARIVHTTMRSFPVAEAREAPHRETPAQRPDAPSFPDITAPRAVVVDTETGAVLGGRNAHAVAPIASITKLMTALIVTDAPVDWNAPVRVSASDERPGGTRILHPGDAVSLRDLFRSTLVGSTNNTAVTMSRLVDKSSDAFSLRMNARADQLGMYRSQFADPTGLNPHNMATAADVARLAHAAFSRAPIREALVLPEYAFRTQRGAPRWIGTTNALLHAPHKEYAVTAGKTGFTPEAGYTFVVEAAQENASVIAVVLGAPSDAERFADADALITWAFDSYRWNYD